MSIHPQPMLSKVILSTMAIGLWSQLVSHGLAQEGTNSNQPSARSNVQVAQRLGTPIRQQGEPVQQPDPRANQATVHGAPFQLSSAEQQFVNQVLMMWENQSNQINTYSCDFQRWEYDPVFGPSGEIPLIKSQGQLTYAKPDKGSFKITDIHRWVQADAQQAGRRHRRAAPTHTRWLPS